VLKSNGKPEGDHVTHFLGWIERHITQNVILKCSYVNDRIEQGPMMWMSSIMDGNNKWEND
jgi:hypothetical protein